MIRQSNIKSKISSIKAAEKSEERKNNRVINTNEEPLTGRMAYCHCNTCDDNAIHKIYVDYIRCTYCDTKVFFPKPKIKYVPILFMM